VNKQKLLAEWQLAGLIRYINDKIFSTDIKFNQVIDIQHIPKVSQLSSILHGANANNNFHT